MRFPVTILTVALATSLAVPAMAQTPRFSVSFDIGPEIALSGDVHDRGNGTVLDLPTTVQARSYDDIYGTMTNWGVTFGTRVATNLEFRIRYNRSTGNASEVRVGDVASLDLFAQFDDYTAQGLDFGLRQYYGSSVQPYAGASVGFVMVDRINSTFSVPAASVVLTDVPMYDDSTVLTFAISGGVLVPIGSNFAVQGGVDFRWTDNLKPIDGLAGTGLENINDKTSRWAMPITFGVAVRF